MNDFLTGNTTKHKVLRTIVQAIISFIAIDGGANLAELFAHIPIDGWMKTMLFGLCMTVLTALMPYFGDSDKPMDKEELPYDYWEKDGDCHE